MCSLNGKTIEHSTTTDFFDRKVSEKASLSSNSASLNTTYSYKEKNNYETTQLNGINVTLGDRTLFNEVYTYDDSGNITLIENASGTDLYKYTYDIQQQITAEYNFVLGTATTYTYDDFGNILTKTPYTNVTSADLTTATVGETKSYTYDTTWTDKLTSFGGESIVYDAIGNPTSYRGATLTWDGRQLMSYSKGGNNISYQYDADGLRTRQLKYDSEGRVSAEINYLWDNGQLIGYTSKMYNYSEENGTTSSSFDVKIHYDEASEPYAVTLGEETYYYIRNAVGDVKGLINADTGEYVYALNTSAYGVLNFIEPDLTFDTSSLIPNPTEAILEAMKKVLLQFCLCLPSANTYKGYSYDIFTGLYYLQSRYYDPEVGRFINADDVDYLGASGKPISYNLFAYCENNPVNNSDASGDSPWTRKLNLWDYRKIHNKVADLIMWSMLAWGARREVYVKGKNGKGFLDVYVTSKNCYYEVKSLGSADLKSTKNQMAKYDVAKVVGSNVGNIKRGTHKVKGSFYYGAWQINYYLKENGLVVYTYTWSQKRFLNAAAVAVVAVTIITVATFATGGATAPAYGLLLVR